MTQLAANQIHNERESVSHLPPSRLPRLGFIGIGWIGLHRMQALIDSGAAQVAAIADPSSEALENAAKLASQAARISSLDDLLAESSRAALPGGALDGVVIATPSALHARQAIAALEHGLPVFCQKPLARTADEARQIVQTAQRVDRLLGVDFSYRHTAAYRAIDQLIRAGELGDLFALDLTFHNAYAPGKSWCLDPALAGGGCMIDLGVHLVDLALLTLGCPAVEVTACDMYARGIPIKPADRARSIEDYATATLRTSSGQSIRIACSWNFSAGQDAVIDFSFCGSRGAAAIRNINGSFYDFRAEHFRGTARTLLSEPPEPGGDWGGKAAIAWARRLATDHSRRGGTSFDPQAHRFINVSEVLERMYQQ